MKFSEALVAFERAAIECALCATGGNVAGAARCLGIGRTTLLSKMGIYGFVASDYEYQPTAEAAQPTQLPAKLMNGSQREFAKLEEIWAVLRACDWNRTESAHRLGISIRTIRMKIRTLQSLGFEVRESRAGGRKRKVPT